MACILRDDLYVGMYRRMAAKLTKGIFFCVLFVPMFSWADLRASPLAQELLNSISMNDPNQMVVHFDTLKNQLELSENRIEEGKRFLQEFIARINTQYNLHLTLSDACKMVRENLHTLQLTEDLQQIVLATINLLQSHEPLSESEKKGFKNALNAHIKLHWPWGWLLGKNKSILYHPLWKVSNFSPLTANAQSVPIDSENELPGQIYAGGAEILAGALIAIVGIVFPPAYGLGTGLIIDGTRRVINGVEEMDKTMQSESESNPFSVNF